MKYSCVLLVLVAVRGSAAQKTSREEQSCLEITFRVKSKLSNLYRAPSEAHGNQWPDITAGHEEEKCETHNQCKYKHVSACVHARMQCVSAEGKPSALVIPMKFYLLNPA